MPSPSDTTVRYTIATLAALLFLVAACDTADVGLDDPAPLVLRGHVVWGPGPVRVDRDVVVEGTLEIRPGTTVEVVRGAEVEYDPAGDYYRHPTFTVPGGRLLAEGREDAPVRFVLVGTSPYGDEGGHLFVDLDAREAPAPSRLAWVELAGSVDWQGGAAHVEHTALHHLSLRHPDTLTVASSAMESLHLLVHPTTGPALREGLVEGNEIGTVFVVGDPGGRLTVRRNRFTSPVFCGRFSHGATSLVERNTFEGCTTGLELVGTGTAPRLAENNFLGQERALVVIPWSHEPDTGTIDARNNWWGTTDVEAVRSRIVYEPNGSNTSNRKVLIEPLAPAPFDL